MTRNPRTFDRAWSWVLKITGWGTFLVGGVIVPLVRFGRIEYGTLVVGTVFAVAGSSDRIIDLLSRRLPEERRENDSESSRPPR